MGKTRKPRSVIRHKIVDYGPGQTQKPEDTNSFSSSLWNFRVMPRMLGFSSLLNLLIHFFSQTVFPEHLFYARPCARTKDIDEKIDPSLAKLMA